MVRLPLPVRFARMLLFANQHQLMPYAVILVSVLSVPNLFLTTHSIESFETNTKMKNQDDKMQNALEQFRVNFVQQFVRRVSFVAHLPIRSDSFLGRLAEFFTTNEMSVLASMFVNNHSYIFDESTVVQLSVITKLSRITRLIQCPPSPVSGNRPASQENAFVFAFSRALDCFPK